MRIDAPKELQRSYRQVLLSPFVKAGQMLIELNATQHDKHDPIYATRVKLARNKSNLTPLTEMAFGFK